MLAAVAAVEQVLEVQARFRLGALDRFLIRLNKFPEIENRKVLPFIPLKQCLRTDVLVFVDSMTDDTYGISLSIHQLEHKLAQFLEARHECRKPLSRRRSECITCRTIDCHTTREFLMES